MAVKGEQYDGHDFIKEARQRGCKAFVIGAQYQAVLDTPFVISVPDTRAALSIIAGEFEGNPSRFLPLVGVTGTNGKTSVAWMIANLSRLTEKPALYLGTLGADAGAVFQEKGNLTTPDPVIIQSYIARARAKGMALVAMEVSSHGLNQKRVESVHYDSAVFTNLTQDHLDYHKTMESYFEAKKRLFDLLLENGKGAKRAVINSDCSYGRQLATEIKAKGLEVVTFGELEGADCRISALKFKGASTEFMIQAGAREYQIRSPFLGRHNAFNLVAALLAVENIFLPLETAVGLTEKIPQVPGRLERVATSSDAVDVYVDYAHTPDALKNVLLTLKEAKSSGKLWVVFGCGGDRDRGKRAIMGQIASRIADRTVITSDNPRTEDPEQIIADMLTSGLKPFAVDNNRENAVFQAITLADPGDTVLVAGKGHEDYQIIGSSRIPFDDRLVSQEALRRRA